MDRVRLGWRIGTSVGLLEGDHRFHQLSLFSAALNSGDVSGRDRDAGGNSLNDHPRKGRVALTLERSR